MTTRKTPPVNLTLPAAARKALDRLTRREAKATGGNPSRLKSNVVARLVLAEDARLKAVPTQDQIDRAAASDVPVGVIMAEDAR